MTLTLEIPSDVERQLAAEAERLGLSLDEFALRLLITHGTLGDRPRNGAELVEYWKSAGVFGARTDITDPAEHARRLRTEAEHRNRDR